MSVHLELTERQARVLMEALDYALPELQTEIARTSSYEFRDNLREQHQVLSQVARQLHRALPTPQREAG